MRYPWANTILLLLLTGQLITGFFGFINGLEQNQWLLWFHGLGAYAVAVILFWKSAIILDVYGRGAGLSWSRIAFAGMTMVLIATLLSGLLWTLNGPHYLFGFSLLTLHIFLAVTLTTLAIWHLLRFRWILRAPGAIGRRSFLQSSAVALTGLLLWRSVDKSKEALAAPGAKRRFTGSFENGSFSGSFPQVSWIADRPSPVDLSTWKLTVDGAVRQPLSISYPELKKMDPIEIDAILDCTGGWYSAQTWRGLGVTHLLELAGVEPSARSVSFRAVSGYERRFWLHEAKEYLLALHVAGQSISHGHGFPIRLVAPGQRGVNWVKWLASIHVNTSSKLWQLPLPLK
jgi:hypothetical protein